MGGSAGVGVLVLASARTTGLALTSLALLAVFTAVSMSLLSGGVGSMLGSAAIIALDDTTAAGGNASLMMIS